MVIACGVGVGTDCARIHLLLKPPHSAAIEGEAVGTAPGV